MCDRVRWIFLTLVSSQVFYIISPFIHPWYIWFQIFQSFRIFFHDKGCCQTCKIFDKGLNIELCVLVWNIGRTTTFWIYQFTIPICPRLYRFLLFWHPSCAPCLLHSSGSSYFDWDQILESELSQVVPDDIFHSLTYVWDSCSSPLAGWRYFNHQNHLFRLIFLLVIAYLFVYDFNFLVFIYYICNDEDWFRPFYWLIRVYIIIPSDSSFLHPSSFQDCAVRSCKVFTYR